MVDDEKRGHPVERVAGLLLARAPDSVDIDELKETVTQLQDRVQKLEKACEAAKDVQERWYYTSNTEKLNAYNLVTSALDPNAKKRRL